MYCHHFLLSFLPFFVFIYLRWKRDTLLHAGHSTAQALIGYTAMAQGRCCELKVADRATALAPIGPWGGGGVQRLHVGRPQRFTKAVRSPVVALVGKMAQDALWVHKNEVVFHSLAQSRLIFDSENPIEPQRLPGVLWWLESPRENTIGSQRKDGEHCADTLAQYLVQGVMIQIHRDTVDRSPVVAL
jgi:hypothetical protein